MVYTENEFNNHSFESWCSLKCKNNTSIESYLDKKCELFFKKIQKMNSSNKYESKELKLNISKQKFKKAILEMVYKYN